MAEDRANLLLSRLRRHLLRFDVVATLGIGAGRTVLIDATALINAMYQPSCQDTPRHTIWKAQQLITMLVTQSQAQVWLVDAPELQALNESPAAGLVLARSVFFRYCQSLEHESIFVRTYTSLTSPEFEEDLRTLVPTAAFTSTIYRSSNVQQVFIDWLKMRLPIVLLEDAELAPPRISAWMIYPFELSNTDEEEDTASTEDDSILRPQSTDNLVDVSYTTTPSDMASFTPMLESAQAVWDPAQALALASLAAATKVARADANADLFTTAVVTHAVLIQTSALRMRNVASPDAAAWSLATGSTPELKTSDQLWNKTLTVAAVLLQSDAVSSMAVLDVVDGRLFRLVAVLLASGQTAKQLLTADGEDKVSTTLVKWMCEALGLAESALETNFGASPDASVTAIVADLTKAAEAARAIAQEPVVLKPMSSSQTLTHFLDEFIEPLKPYEAGPTPDLETFNPVWHSAGFNAEFRHDSDRFGGMNNFTTSDRHRDIIIQHAARYRVAVASKDPLAIRDAAELLFGVLPVERAAKFQNLLNKNDTRGIDIMFDKKKPKYNDPPYAGIHKMMTVEAAAKQKAATNRQVLAESLVGGPIQNSLIVAGADRHPSDAALRAWERGIQNKIDGAIKELVAARKTLPRKCGSSMTLEEERKVTKHVLEVTAKSKQRSAVLLAIGEITNKQSRAKYDKILAKMDDAELRMSVVHLAVKLGLFFGKQQLPKEPLDFDVTEKSSTEEQKAAVVLAEALRLSSSVQSKLALAKGISELEPVMTIIGEQAQGLQELLAAYGYTQDVPADKLARFNLRVMGSHFHRPQGQEDGRSPHFRPDGWQRSLLSAVDDNRSALIAAPTSSGKTFISFYAMEQVLRGCTGIQHKAVYLAPTKTLVNQVEAEITARFAKNYGDRSGSVVGIFTSDYRSNVDNCQILVATPQCFEILLLHPTVGEGWRKALKWVIFDEIHRITDEDGKIWEQLLGLIDCPFLALSATIGNVGHLRSWLESLEAARGRTDEKGLEFILHNKRWNDLDYTTFHAEVGQSEECELRDVNPIALFSRSRLMEERWMSLVRLVPEQLQRTLEMLEKLPTPPEGLQAALEYRNTHLGVVGLPEMFGSGELSPLEQLQTDVKQCIRKLAIEDGDRCHAFLQSLGFETPTIFYRQAHEGQAMKMLYDELVKRDALPALFFRLSIGQLEGLAFRLVEEVERQVPDAAALSRTKDYRSLLQTTEQGLLEDADLRAAKVAEGMDDWAFNDWAKAAAARKTIQSLRDQYTSDELVAKTRKYQTYYNQRNTQLINDSEARDELKQENGWTDAQYDEHCASQAEAYALVKARAEYLEKYGYNVPGQQLISTDTIKELYRPSFYEKDTFDRDLLTNPFFRALQAGIGIHHSGLSVRKRRLVEYLFRDRRLALVLATGTLAVGISMPCPTVIISGDSPHLDPTNFHQMAGRAGRRGYDLRGHVILFNVPETKLRFCLTEGINSNSGNTPLSVSLVMRGLTRLRNAQANVPERKAVVDGLNRMLHMPLAINSQSDRERHVLKYLTTAIAEYLMRVGAFSFFVVEREAKAEPVVKAAAASIKAAGDEDGDDDDDDLMDDWDASDDDDEEEEAAAVVSVPTTETQDDGLTVTSDLNVMSSFVSHLAFTEPCNLLLCHLLSTGFHKQLFTACNNDHALVKDQLMLIMAHTMLIRRGNIRFLERALQDRRHSTVQLPALHPSLQSVGDTFNALALESFTKFARAGVAADEVIRDGIASDGLDLSTLSSTEAAVTRPALAQFVQATTARNPVDGLAGGTDKFESVDDIMTSFSGLGWLHRELLPTVDFQPAEVSESNLFDGHWKNAYVYDYWKHGNIKAIEEENGIRTNQLYDAYKLMNRNMQVIARTVWCRRGEEPAKDTAAHTQWQQRQAFISILFELRNEIQARFKETQY
eukprot:m.227299 g.227299  ORF g.227299 m.227299 type:complete len:1916 (+) comp17321_c0_seq1:124-5871(+)